MKMLIALVLSAFCLAAHAEPATEASIDELLTVTRAPQMLDLMKDNMQKGMSAGLHAAMQGKSLTKNQVAYLDSVPVKFRATMDRNMRWSDMRPMMVQLYEQNFTEQEVRAAITFYQSPEGTAFITKMPTVTLQAQQLMLQHISDMAQQMKEQMAQAVQEAQTMQ
jgi:hypothetical protein